MRIILDCDPGHDDAMPVPGFFFAETQGARTNQVLLVRATGNVKSLEKPIRDIINRIDPIQPVYDVRLMQDRVRDTWGTQRLLTFLFAVFAALALLLATIGLYGVLAYTTVKRIREIGLRVALGAQPAQIRALVLSHGMQLFMIGSAIGLLAALALSRALQSMLFEAKGLDPRIYFAVGTLLFAATLLASWIPARRASRVDPIVALRTE